jgi:hypothetical protein
MAVVARNRPTQSGVVGVPSLPHGGAAVTPSDTDYFDRPTYVEAGGAGVLNVVPWANGVGGTAVPVTVPAGGGVKFMVVQVLATDTTATLITAAF